MPPVPASQPASAGARDGGGAGRDRGGLPVQRGEHRDGDGSKDAKTQRRQPSGPAPKALIFLYLNAQSVVNKIDELSCVVSEVKPDIVLITESWCNDNISDAYLGLEGFELQTELRQDRADTGRGPIGVCETRN